MNRSLFFQLLCTIMILSGCASRGFNHGELRKELNMNPVVTDHEIKEVLKLKPQLPKPFKIALFFNDSGTKNNETKWRWNEEDKQKILSIKEEILKNKEVSDVFIINSSLVTDTDLKSLRLAASKHGADALLVINGAVQKDQYPNKWGWTYIALVTAFFVPATELEVLFLSQATMWDVRNEYLYLTAESETLKKDTLPVGLIDLKKSVEEAKKESLNNLREEILKNLKESINQSNQKN